MFNFLKLCFKGGLGPIVILFILGEIGPQTEMEPVIDILFTILVSALMAVLVMNFLNSFNRIMDKKIGTASWKWLLFVVFVMFVFAYLTINRVEWFSEEILRVVGKVSLLDGFYIDKWHLLFLSMLMAISKAWSVDKKRMMREDISTIRVELMESEDHKDWVKSNIKESKSYFSLDNVPLIPKKNKLFIKFMSLFGFVATAMSIFGLELSLDFGSMKNDVFGAIFPPGSEISLGDVFADLSIIISYFVVFYFIYSFFSAYYWSLKSIIITNHKNTNVLLSTTTEIELLKEIAEIINESLFQNMSSVVEIKEKLEDIDNIHEGIFKIIFKSNDGRRAYAVGYVCESSERALRGMPLNNLITAFNFRLTDIKNIVYYFIFRIFNLFILYTFVLKLFIVFFINLPWQVIVDLMK